MARYEEVGDGDGEDGQYDDEDDDDYYDDLSVRLKQQQVYRYFNRITRSLARAPRDAVDEPGS